VGVVVAELHEDMRKGSEKAVIDGIQSQQPDATMAQVNDLHVFVLAAQNENGHNPTNNSEDYPAKMAKMHQSLMENLYSTASSLPQGAEPRETGTKDECHLHAPNLTAVALQMAALQARVLATEARLTALEGSKSL